MKTLNKQLLFVAILLIGVVTFAQKEEMKAATKAVNKSAFSEALATLNKLDVTTLDDKTKAKYLFLKAKALNGSGKISAAGNAINKLIAFEKKTGKSKYTNSVEPMLQKLVQKLRDKGIKEYGEKKFKLSKNTLAQIYELNQLDTTFLFYAAMSAYQDKDLDLSLIHYAKLVDVGYTGIETKYYATNISTNERYYFPNKERYDLLSKTKLYKDPNVEVLKSKKGEIIKNMAYIYLDKDDNEKAFEVINKAREEAPKDVGIILSAADIAYKMKDNKKYLSLMTEAIAYKPNNAQIYNNIGIVNRVEGNIEKSKESFKKAISLDPKFKMAIINLAELELLKEDAIVKEMDANTNDFDKYDELKAKQLNLYREVLPLYEEAYAIDDPNFDKGTNKRFLSTLMAIYENLEMYDKVKEVKVIYDGL